MNTHSMQYNSYWLYAGFSSTFRTQYPKACAITARQLRLGIPLLLLTCLHNFNTFLYWLSKAFFYWDGIVHLYLSHSEEPELS